jgi:hypothetical protein
MQDRQYILGLSSTTLLIIICAVCKNGGMLCQAMQADKDVSD